MNFISPNIIISILIFFLDSRKSFSHDLAEETNIVKVVTMLKYFETMQHQYQLQYLMFENDIQISSKSVLSIIEGIAKTRTDIRKDIFTARKMLATVLDNGDFYTMLTIMIIKSMALLYAFSFSEGHFTLKSFNTVKSTEEAKDCAELAVILAIFGVSVDTSQVLLNENYEDILSAQNRKNDFKEFMYLQQHLTVLEKDIMESIILNYDWENREICWSIDFVDETNVKKINSFLHKWIYDNQIMGKDHFSINKRLIESAGEILMARKKYAMHLILMTEKSNGLIDEKAFYKSYVIHVLLNIEFEKLLYNFPGETRKDIKFFIQNIIHNLLNK